MNRISDASVANPVWIAQQHGTQVGKVPADPASVSDLQPSQRAEQIGAVDAANDAAHSAGLLSEEAGQALVDKLNESASHQDLVFSVDQESGSTVIQVTSRDTGEVVRQIPNEEALNMMREMLAQTPISVESARIFDQSA